MPCAATCRWGKKCAQSYELGRPECVKGVQTVRQDFDNGAPAMTLHLHPDEIEIITVDPQNPDDIMKFRAVAGVSDGSISVYKAE